MSHTRSDHDTKLRCTETTFLTVRILRLTKVADLGTLEKKNDKRQNAVDNALHKLSNGSSFAVISQEVCVLLRHYPEGGHVGAGHRDVSTVALAYPVVCEMRVPKTSQCTA